MTERDHPIDKALRKIAGTPKPTSEDVRLAQERLAGAIAAEQRGQPANRRPRLVTIWAAGVLAILVGLLVVLQTVSPRRSEAAMEEIAIVAEATNPLLVPEQSFLYTRSVTTAISVVSADALSGTFFTDESLVYLLPTVRETWFGQEGTVQIRTTNLKPVFFSQRDERAYFEAGIDHDDAIGETISQTVTQESDLADWPTNPAALDQALAAAARTDRDLPPTVEYLDVALDLLREVFTPPDLRAATLRLIGQLPDLEVAERSEDGAVTLSIEYTDQGVRTALRFTVDPQGHLVSEETLALVDDPHLGIPADTAISKTEYDPPLIVDGLDKP